MLGCIFYRYKSKKPEKTMDKNRKQDRQLKWDY